MIELSSGVPICGHKRSDLLFCIQQLKSFVLGASLRPYQFLKYALMAAAFLAGATTLAFAQTAESLPMPTGQTVLRIEGAIARTNLNGQAVFDRQMLNELERHELETHTSVTDGPQHFEGFLMRDLLDLVGAEGEMATAHALNDYVVDIPMSDFKDFDVLVAMEMNGKQLTARDKGPLWIVYPRDDVEELQDIRYDYRWVWHLDSLKIQ